MVKINGDELLRRCLEEIAKTDSKLKVGVMSEDEIDNAAYCDYEEQMVGEDSEGNLFDGLKIAKQLYLRILARTTLCFNLEENAIRNKLEQEIGDMVKDVIKYKEEIKEENDPEDVLDNCDEYGHRPISCVDCKICFGGKEIDELLKEEFNKKND